MTASARFTAAATTRNEAVIADYKSGMTYREVGAKYGISVTRSRQIVVRAMLRLAQQPILEVWPRVRNWPGPEHVRGGRPLDMGGLRECWIDEDLEQ